MKDGMIQDSARPQVVLVVEDEPSIVELLSALIAQVGAQLLAARSGAQGLELAERERPAVITIDLLLPDMDGYKLLTKLRDRPELADVPILVISAQADSGSQRRAFQSGATDFMPKPFPIDLFEAKLRTWLRCQRLSELGRRLRDLVHEARNPLSAISAAAQVVGRLDADPVLRRRLARAIEEEADRLARLLQAVLLGEGQTEARTEAPLRLLRDVVDVNLPDPAARARVHLRCTGALPPVTVHPDRLRQMLVNLLANAVAATDLGGSVEIEALADESGVAVAIHDSGPGIAPADLPHIFTDGFTRRPGSQGLGLGIVRRLCQLAGGRLHVESTPGQGSTFSLWLPRC
jgi:signal transduction histidine kinase